VEETVEVVRNHGDGTSIEGGTFEAEARADDARRRAADERAGVDTRKVVDGGA
jgi:hypothetical protein